MTRNSQAPWIWGGERCKRSARLKVECVIEEGIWAGPVDITQNRDTGERIGLEGGRWWIPFQISYMWSVYEGEVTIRPLKWRAEIRRESGDEHLGLVGIQETTEIIGVIETVKRKCKRRKRKEDTKNLTLWFLISMIRSITWVHWFQRNG